MVAVLAWKSLMIFTALAGLSVMVTRSVSSGLMYLPRLSVPLTLEQPAPVAAPKQINGNRGTLRLPV